MYIYVLTYMYMMYIVYVYYIDQRHGIETLKFTSRRPLL